MAILTAKTSVVLYDDFTDEDGYITKPAEFVKKFHGQEYTDEYKCHPDETMSEYFYVELPDGSNIQDIGITGGGIRLEYNKEENYLVAISEFESPRLLSEAEIEVFMKEYTGQMLDGMGWTFLIELFDELTVEFEVIYLENGVRFPEATFSQVE